MSRLRIFKNPVDGGEEVLHVRTDDVLKVFIEAKNKHSKARIYIQPACSQNDVTPTNKVDETSLQMLAKTHDFDIVCGAGEPATIIAVVSLVVSLSLSIYTMLNMPKNKGGEQGSSNNNLAESQNQQRIGGRAADIYGIDVPSVPDLIAPDVSIFENNKQSREQFMLIGRGYFKINSKDILAGETPFESIEGASMSIYAPGVDVVRGVPQLQIGSIFDYAPYIAKASKSINDQLLAVPNELIISSSTLYFEAPNLIKSKTGVVPAGLIKGDQILIRGAKLEVNDQRISGQAIVHQNGSLSITTSQQLINFSALNRIRIDSLLVNKGTTYIDLAGEYQVSSVNKTSDGFIIQLFDYQYANPDWALIEDELAANLSALLFDTTTFINLDGKYNVTSVNSDVIALDVPSAMVDEWSKVQSVFGGNTATETVDLSIDKLNDKWVGWIEYDDDKSTDLWVNLQAPQGLWYQDSKGAVWAHDVRCKIQWQRIVNKEPVGNVFERLTSLWSAEENKKDSVGKTEKIALGFKGRFRFRVCRITEDDLSPKISDEVNVTDAYAVYQIDKTAYEGLTLIRSRVVADKTALSIRDNRIKLLVSKLLYSYSSGSRSPERLATNNFADIVCDITLDDFIGRRSLEDIDVKSLYATSNRIAAYFGTSNCCEFNGTFDQSNLSYEETLQQIASVVFCNARRANGKTFFEFERENASSSILFNHRNKKPRTQTITETMRDQNQYDGVEVKWRDPDDNHADTTLKIPHDGITNAKKVDAFGVTNKVQAHMLGWRVWNKLQYQKLVTQFTAYGEADLVTIGDRIAVTDDVSPSLVPMGAKLNLTSGEVVAWSGQNISVSQPISLLENRNYTIHLQLSNGSVETMSVEQGTDEYSLILERLPMLQLVTQFDRVARTVYSITLDDARDSEAFIITEKSVGSTFLSTVTAQNYDVRYWSNDKDHIKNLI